MTEYQITGVDASSAANEITGAIADYASTDPTWIEILEVGSGTVRSVRRLEPDREGAEPEITKLDPNSMMSALVSGITSSNATLSARVNHLENELTASTNARIELAGKAAMAETLVIVEREKAAWMAEHSSDDGMAEAMKQLAPLLSPIGGALAAKIAGAKPKTDPKPDPKAEGEAKAETPGQHADRLIAEVNDLCEAHPDVLRERTPQLLMLGARLQALITSAPSA